MASWVEARCAHCQNVTRIARDKAVVHAGKSFACQACGQPVAIPQVASHRPVKKQHVPLQQRPHVRPAQSMMTGGAGSRPAAYANPAVTAYHQKQEERSRQRRTLFWIFVPVSVISLFVVVGGSVGLILHMSYMPKLGGGDEVVTYDGDMVGSDGKVEQPLPPPAPRSLGTFVLDFPPAARSGTQVFIDGREMQMPATGDFRFNLPSGEHELAVKFQDESVASHKFRLSAGDEYTYRLPPPIIAKLRENTPSAGDQAGADGTDDSGFGVFASWSQSVEEARERARVSGKNLLIYFDGSDWCPYCKQLTGNVLETPVFEKFAAENYELVHLDFPRYQAARQQVEDPARNGQMAEYYRVFSYPMLVMADSDGQPIVKIGYDQSGAGAFVSKLGKIQRMSAQRDERIAQIESILRSGQKPDAALVQSVLPEDMVPYYSTLMAKWYGIASESDPQNQTGLRESMFWLWWITNQQRPDLNVPDRLREMRDVLTNFTDECEFSDPEEAAKLYLVMAAITRRVDVAESQSLAEQGLPFAPKDSGLKEMLAQLSQGILSGGSGVVISKAGYLLTNQHVVSYADEVVVTLGDQVDQEYTAKVVARNVPEDLALLKLKDAAPESLHPLPLMETPVEKGADIFVCGFPGFEKYMVITNGIVSLPAKQQPDKMILLDSTVNPGNSGGPLIAPSGQVAGLLVMKTLTSEDTDSMGLAIPVDRMHNFLKQHLSGLELKGVAVESARSAKARSLNRSVEPGTARILVKQVVMNYKDANAVNGTVWNLVKVAGRSDSEYRMALTEIRRVCLAFPNANNLNTLGVALYRTGRYHEAIEVMTEAASEHEDDLGVPHPLDLAVIAMAHHQVGEPRLALSVYRQMNELMQKNGFAQNEECQQFLAETQKVLQIQ